jgi:hypothetical protein
LSCTRYRNIEIRYFKIELRPAIDLEIATSGLLGDLETAERYLADVFQGVS